jgi:CubicO group peptidase (beta-lactamase class C family)
MRSVKPNWIRIVIPAVMSVAATCGVTAADRSHSPRPGPVFPGEQWQRRTPAEVGLETARLDEFRNIVGGRGCVVRDGYLAYCWGEYDRPHDVASALKPFYSYFLMQALAAGKLRNLDARVADYWQSEPAVRQRTDHPDQRLTFRHLGFQTACLGYREAPGEAFDYNDATMGFFWDTLINKVFGVPWEEAEARVIEPLLTRPLQFEDGTPGVLQSKTGRFRVSARDFCRFGLLFLHGGMWSERQVLRKDLAVRLVTNPLPLTIPRSTGEARDTIFPLRSIGGGGNQCDHHGGYSWMWWLNRTARDGALWFPDVPEDFYACFGHGGQEGMAVLPSQGILVSWIGKRLHQDRERGNRAFRLLVDAAR